MIFLLVISSCQKEIFEDSNINEHDAVESSNEDLVNILISAGTWDFYFYYFVSVIEKVLLYRLRDKHIWGS